MQVEHEVDERPFQPRAGPSVEGKPGAGKLGAPLEIEDAQRFADFPVRFRGKGKVLGISPQVLTTTLSASDAPTGTSGCGMIRHGQQETVQAPLRPA